MPRTWEAHAAGGVGGSPYRNDHDGEVVVASVRVGPRNREFMRVSRSASGRPRATSSSRLLFVSYSEGRFEPPRPIPEKRKSCSHADCGSGETRTRTGDTTIFSRALLTAKFGRFAGDSFESGGRERFPGLSGFCVHSPSVTADERAHRPFRSGNLGGWNRPSRNASALAAATDRVPRRRPCRGGRLSSRHGQDADGGRVGVAGLRQTDAVGATAAHPGCSRQVLASAGVSSLVTSIGLVVSPPEADTFVRPQLLRHRRQRG